MPLIRNFLHGDLTYTQKVIIVATGPLENLLLALLPVVGYTLLRYRRTPSRPMIFVIFIGSQFPDMVDKTLEFVRIVPWGRVGMHSLVFAVPFILSLVAYATVTDRPHLGAGFGFSYAVGWFLDFYNQLLSGTIPPSILWPFSSLSKPAATTAGAYWGGPGGIFLLLWSGVSVLILAIALVLLVRDVSTHLGQGTHDRRTR